jgi:hypothetical protein
MKYQKIRPLGHRTLKQLWDGEVEITEKVDGSQYRWWRSSNHGDPTFHHGTKRTELHVVDGGVPVLTAFSVKHLPNLNTILSNIIKFRKGILLSGVPMTVLMTTGSPTHSSVTWRSISWWMLYLYAVGQARDSGD